MVEVVARAKSYASKRTTSIVQRSKVDALVKVAEKMKCRSRENGHWRDHGVFLPEYGIA
jgi:hypothetical protein